MRELHGLSKHRLYSVWKSLKTRCYNNKHIQYKDYGGRNITICNEWLNSFLSFYDFCISHGWLDGLEIDRINNDGNYEPNNVQFITCLENCTVGKKRKYENNKSGYNGVHYSFIRNKFISRISINGKRIHLGSFNTKVEALQARIDAELLYFNEQLTNL